MPTRRWLVAAFYDSMTDKQKIESDIRNDIADFSSFSKIRPFPYDILTDYIWYDVNSLSIKRNNHDYSYYLNYSGIIPAITAQYASIDDYIGLVLLLDRDLLSRNSSNNLYAPLVRHDFFRPNRHPCHFVCCFGGTPQDGMRCRVSSISKKVCQIHARGCSSCDSDEKLFACNHTCYWFFIGLLLGAYLKPERKNSQGDDDIKKALPLPYIY